VVVPAFVVQWRMYVKTDCGLVGKNQRRKHVNRHISGQMDGYCIWFIGFLRGNLHTMALAKERNMWEMNVATITFMAGVMAVAIFGIYLAKTGKG